VVGHPLDDGGLAGTVVAEQSDDLAAADVEADIVDGLQVASAPAQLLRFDPGLWMG